MNLSDKENHLVTMIKWLNDSISNSINIDLGNSTRGEEAEEENCAKRINRVRVSSTE